MVGMYSGAITNTPALSAASLMVTDIGTALQGLGKDPIALGLDVTKVPKAYAVAYLP